ncbi:MAG TPA: signal peptidase II [Candidatus Baltobacteraceae bacterium]|nr:signal peptidase II [Candidatus Baltobacteraceae bacterium]
MSRSRSSESAQLFGVAAVVVALDQYTKHLVTGSFLPGESRFVIPRFLKWTYEQNQHGAFGLFGSSPVLLILMALIVLLIFWYSFRDQARESLLVRIAFGMILGGAAGNIADRLHYRYVVDFVDFYRIWPNIFNVADACITIGVVLLIIASLARRRHA